jgi:hypothetical protein
MTTQSYVFGSDRGWLSAVAVRSRGGHSRFWRASRGRAAPVGDHDSLKSGAGGQRSALARRLVAASAVAQSKRPRGVVRDLSRSVGKNARRWLRASGSSWEASVRPTSCSFLPGELERTLAVDSERQLGRGERASRAGSCAIFPDQLARMLAVGCERPDRREKRASAGAKQAPMPGAAPGWAGTERRGVVWWSCRDTASDGGPAL